MNRKSSPRMLIKMIVFLTVCLACNISALCQKTILLDHTSSKAKKVYNMDGAELYLIFDNDTTFVSKVDKYRFQTTVHTDSIVRKHSDSSVHFLIKTVSNCYHLFMPKKFYSSLYSEYEFSFYTLRNLRKARNRLAIHYPDSSVSSTAPAIITSNKRGHKKFYPYIPD